MIEKVVPFLSLTQSISPLCWVIIPLDIASPNPEVISLVETSGKKIESIKSSGIPGPLSLISIKQADLWKVLLMNVS